MRYIVIISLVLLVLISGCVDTDWIPNTLRVGDREVNLDCCNDSLSYELAFPCPSCCYTTISQTPTVTVAAPRQGVGVSEDTPVVIITEGDLSHLSDSPCKEGEIFTYHADKVGFECCTDFGGRTYICSPVYSGGKDCYYDLNCEVQSGSYKDMCEMFKCKTEEPEPDNLDRQIDRNATPSGVWKIEVKEAPA